MLELRGKLAPLKAGDLHEPLASTVASIVVWRC
jgi:hypothetical protein